MTSPIRVLIADDSSTVRTALRAIVQASAGLVVVGEAADGIEAIERNRELRPDVITMDVNMPRLDGLGATTAIMAEAPARVLVVASIAEGHQVDLSFRAISVGAMEVISKPADGGDLVDWGRRVVESIRLMAEVPVVTRRIAQRLELPPPTHAVDVVGIAASTGGPAALAFLLPTLPRDMPITIFIAQHIASGFTEGLVRWWGSLTKVPIAIAIEGERARPGVIYLPQDGHHLEVDRERKMRLFRSEGGHVPSGNRLLGSLARAWGARACGVVLTGMGEDGAEGLLAMRRAGGVTLAQDEASSVVFGMPNAARSLGAIDKLLSLEAIALAVREMSSRAATG